MVWFGGSSKEFEIIREKKGTVKCMHVAFLAIRVSPILSQTMSGKDGPKGCAWVVINSIAKLANFWYY
jgi:hypothetical protein